MSKTISKKVIIMVQAQRKSIDAQSLRKLQKAGGKVIDTVNLAARSNQTCNSSHIDTYDVRQEKIQLKIRPHLTYGRISTLLNPL